MTPTHLGFAAVVTLVAWIALHAGLRIARTALDAVAGRSGSKVARAVADIVRGTSGVLVVLTAILIGFSTLTLPPQWAARVSHLWFLTLMVQVALWCNSAIAIGLEHYFRRVDGDGSNLAQASATSTLLSWALHTALWTTVLLAILANLGVNITAFIASLGVGGIAVALAAQNVLGDLFASLSIAIDKPFEVGDAIAVGTVSGTVERVGLKTTRLRSTSGEQIVMSNTDLLKQTVRNYKRMQTRRVVYPIGIRDDASPEQVEAVPAIVRRLVEADPGLRFDRAHLKGFGESSIDFECVFHVQTPDYGVYMDSQQALGLGLMRAFAELGVSFASPSRRVHLAGAPAPLPAPLPAPAGQAFAAPAPASSGPDQACPPDPASSSR